MWYIECRQKLLREADLTLIKCMTFAENLNDQKTSYRPLIEKQWQLHPLTLYPNKTDRTRTMNNNTNNYHKKTPESQRPKYFTHK